MPSLLRSRAPLRRLSRRVSRLAGATAVRATPIGGIMTPMADLAPAVPCSVSAGAGAGAAGVGLRRPGGPTLPQITCAARAPDGRQQLADQDSRVVYLGGRGGIKTNPHPMPARPERAAAASDHRRGRQRRHDADLGVEQGGLPGQGGQATSGRVSTAAMFIKNVALPAGTQRCSTSCCRC